MGETVGMLKNLVKNKKILYLNMVILLILSFIIYKNTYHEFDESLFSSKNVYNHIRELSSPPYNGRYPGTEGNRLALNYVQGYFEKIGISPAGEDGTYYQQFESMIPFYNSSPHFNIVDGENNIIKEFRLRTDYVDALFGSGEVHGELFLLEKNITNYSAEEIKNKVIVGIMPRHFQARDLQLMVNNGVRAILTTTDFGYYNSKPVRMSKASTNIGQIEVKGKPIIINILNRLAYMELKRLAESNMKADIKYDMTFKKVEVPNILGKIEGAKRDGGYLIISGHIDHMGSDPNGNYFPGAFDDASGIGMMLELARVIKEQERPPDKTILFVGWNNEENGVQGSKYYVDHPIYPLSQSEVIQIDGIGLKEINEIVLDSTGDRGSILRNKLYQYAKDLEGKLEIGVHEIQMGMGSDHQYFLQRNVPAVLIQDNYEDRRDLHFVHMYEDNIDNISVVQIDRGAQILLQYIKREIFYDTLPDYLNRTEKSLLSIVVFFTIALFLINNMKKSSKVLKISIEDIYYSSSYQIFQRIFNYGLLAFFTLYLIIWIIHVPTNFNLLIEDGQIYTNLSLFLTMKNSVLYLRNFIENGFGVSIRYIMVWDIITASFIRSSQLIVVSIGLAAGAGILKGIYDGYREKPKIGRASCRERV